MTGMTARKMMELVQTQLAIDLNCSISDLGGAKDSFIFVECRDNPGRRPFPRGKTHFEMLTMGRSIVVSATPEVLAFVKPQLIGADRDSAFAMPFVYGHSLYYLPHLGGFRSAPAPEGFQYEIIERGSIPELYKLDGFRNALQYDVSHPRPDVIAALAIRCGKVIGIAGASADCAKMWQIGIDVLPEHRNNGIATYLVNWLTVEILNRNIVPYYGTSSSNIASQRVAHRAGYSPAWVCAYKGRFEGYDTCPTG